MTPIYFVFSYQFIVFLTSRDNVVMGSGPPALKLTIAPQKNEAVMVTLKKTDQLLANKFLPVWTINEDSPDTLKKNEEVMKEIHPFTFYQDPKISSAAVLFERQQKMHGIVDTRVIIESTDLHFTSSSKPIFLTTGVKHRSQSRFLGTTLSKSISRTPEGFNGHQNRNYDKYLNEKTEVTRLCREAPNWNYIETLVLVNYDMVEELQNEPHNYSPIVSYVLALFNNVDMLYAKISTLPIILNLAGIIIASSRKVFPLHAAGDCYEQIHNKDGILEDNMDIRCINRFIGNFCDKHAKTIPPGTYDVALLLTRYGLHHHKYDPRTGDRKLKEVGGLAESPDEYYDRMKMGTMPTLVATISDRGEYESFPIIAHEMAHLFNVEHDEPTGEQHKLMQPNGKHSVNTLSWSRASIASLKIFFESNNACIFKNLPSSLVRPGPHKIWDTNRQCRCYGYKSAAGNFLNRFIGSSRGVCDHTIKCVDVVGEVHEGPVFLDGTPCERKKVCWAGKCVAVGR